MKDRLLKWFFRFVTRLVLYTFTPCTVIGRENIPDPKDGPLLIVGNHFSYFEAPLIASLFYHHGLHAFATSDALGKSNFIDGFYQAYRDKIILVERGKVDRKSLQRGLQALQEGGWLMLFPEGGVTAESVGMARQGKSANELKKRSYTRDPAVLFPPRAGSAMLATQTQARVLPVATWGTERVESRIRRLKRTRVTMRIGEPLPPMTTPEGVRGRERRAHIDEMSDQIMQAIAALIPEEYRGPYQS